MGIKDLSKLLREKYSEQMLEFDFSELSGFVFAVDISSLIYRYIRSVEEWMLPIVMTFCTLRKYGITCLCVFDGDSVTPEKQIIRNQRKSDLEKRMNKIHTAEQLLNKMGDTDVTEEATKLLQNTRIGKNLSIKERLELVVSKSRQVECITLQHIEETKKVLGLMGISYYQAKGEADGHCVWLVKNNYADAVLSEDTDMLAYGCPILFSFKEYKLSEQKIYGINLKYLLQSMEMTLSEFRDLCILLSCDYNKRVKGFPPTGRKYKTAVNIGSVGALAMIKTFKTLEASKQYIQNIENLNISVCRKYFTMEYPVNEKEIVKSKLDIDGVLKYFMDRDTSIDGDFIVDALSPSTITFE